MDRKRDPRITGKHCEGPKEQIDYTLVWWVLTAGFAVIGFLFGWKL